MKVVFKKSFLKELKKLDNKTLKNAVYNAIIQAEEATQIQDIKNLKKLAGYDCYYRIRIGDYRIGLKQEGHTLYFVIIEHRKDIYKLFP
jgi:mRNA interferase RelE/StbE